MGVITTTEQALVEATQKAFANRLKAVGPVPGPITTEVLRQMIAAAPAVHFAFLGGSAAKDRYDPAIEGRWTAYVASRNAGGGLARLHGDPTEIGIYDIVERLAPAIHDLTITGVGTCRLVDVQNLFSIQLQQKLGAALWAVVFSVPMPIPDEADLSGLDDFATFDAQYDIDPMEIAAEHQKWLQEPPDHTTSQPDAEDELTGLDQ